MDLLSDDEIIRRFGRPRAIQGEIVDVTPTPTRTGIVPARPAWAPARPFQTKPRPAEGDGPPSYWEPQASAEWRYRVWADFPVDYKNRLLAQRAGAAFSVRSSDAPDAVILRSQEHALKALAIRLDAGIATAREALAFEAGLREYKANYDCIRAQRKALPG